ncbi:hypothetical protein LUD75_09315 [Epilithonimonas sp. JDS]|uniref:hypothetical protein n=1 Tax=Epilithonimonas sp. JDS TaxID=2902797 RepID=UPI001E4EB344|nr:hypothetical protein [Epilithonimonas sp. JDS]MCD9854903.1 hypothetical protein [Epilithonimonas sp. JDS]
MSYDIQLYRTETKDREKKSGDENFFDDENNLEPFTEEQYNNLKDRLLKYNYILNHGDKRDLQFAHPDYNINILLTDRGLYFTSGFDDDSIFEAGMTASEFTDTDEFAKYDPQNDGWEEF